MKVYSIFNNLNTQLPLSVSVVELDNSSDLTSYKEVSAAAHFDILKRYHFYFPAEKVGDIIPAPVYDPSANYSNYSIDKIDLADFKHIQAMEYKETAAQRLREWAMVYGTIDKSELDWFIETVLKQIQDVAEDYTDGYLFDWPAQAVHEKRHPHFTLYEFFFSLIFYGNRDNNKLVGYVLLAYA